MHSSKRQKQEQVLRLLPVCALLVLIAIVNLISRDKAYSDMEKRPLATRPAASASALWDGSFFDAANTWYADQFTGRDLWIRLHAFGRSLTGVRQAGDVLKGKDGYLFMEPATPESETIARTQEAIGQFATSHSDVPMHLLLVPDAACVLQDKLPHGAPIRDQAADIQDFLKGLPGTIDAPELAPVLREQTDTQLYYRSDHHWTTDGAFLTFMHTAPNFGIPELPAYTRYLATERFSGTLSAKSGERVRDPIWLYAPENMPELVLNLPDSMQKSASLYQSEALEGNDPYTVFFGGNHPIAEISTTNMNDRHLLVLKDSYANSFVPFLAPYFETITMVDPRYYYEDLGALMNQKGITEVLFLYSADTLFEDTALATVLSP